ncbi:MAG: GNAT family N-acetyltransferase [Acidimicrobiales bacterium]
MPRVRLGVVLVIPEPVGREVDGLRRALGSGALGRIPPHITLVPPINVAEAELGTALEVLRAAAGQVRPLELELGPAATFWPANPVVYLSVGGAGLPGVERLRGALLRPPLDRPSDQAFVPHVTVRDNVDPELIPAALALLGAYRAEVSVEVVHLLAQRAGQVWESVGSARLSAPAVIGRGGLAVEVSGALGLDAQAAAWAAAAWASYVTETYGEGAVSDRPFAFAARLARRVVGVAEGSVGGCGTGWPTATLSRLVVAPSSRSQGVGSHLLAAVESHAASESCVSLRALVRVGSPAVTFYLARGFAPSAELPAWRAGCDFVVMERSLR